MQKGVNKLFIVLVGILILGTDLRGATQDKTIFNLLDSSRHGGDWVSLSENREGEATAILSFDLKPLTGNAGVAVTLVFREPESGYMKIFWTGESNNETLSDDFYDGIALPNQKTIVIPSRLTQGSGTLEILYTGKAGSVRAVSFEALDLETVASAGSLESVSYVARSGRAIHRKDVSGDNVALMKDEWQGNTIFAPLIDLPEKLNETVAVSFSVEQLPLLGRLSAKLAGVDAFSRIQVWINGHNAGALQVHFPELSDMGYRLGTDGKIVFDGWAQASLLVPADLLLSGENMIQLILESDTKKNFAVKEMVIQMNYPAVADTSADKPSEGNPDSGDEAKSSPPAAPRMNEENHENDALPTP
ncbi:MAG: hypothetical protein SGI98_09865 [Verrucomicrobiota bacterium]|nr:hypothetical protein [Verrucomicrobiota bacterium]